jgi:hypothetical protein
VIVAGIILVAFLVLMGIMLFKSDAETDFGDHIKIRSKLPLTVTPSTGFKYVIYDYFIRGKEDYTQGLFVFEDNPS